jgi:hypothetical protein
LLGIAVSDVAAMGANLADESDFGSADAVGVVAMERLIYFAYCGVNKHQ